MVSPARDDDEVGTPQELKAAVCAHPQAGLRAKLPALGLRHRKPVELAADFWPGLSKNLCCHASFKEALLRSRCPDAGISRLLLSEELRPAFCLVRVLVAKIDEFL